MLTLASGVGRGDGRVVSGGAPAGRVWLRQVDGRGWGGEGDQEHCPQRHHRLPVPGHQDTHPPQLHRHSAQVGRVPQDYTITEHKSAACVGGEVAKNQAPLHRCCTDYFNTAENESCIT